MLISEAKQIIKHANSTRTHLKVIKTYIMQDRPCSTTWTNYNHWCTVCRVNTVLFHVCLWLLIVILALISPSIQQTGVSCIFLNVMSFRQSVSQLTGRGMEWKILLITAQVLKADHSYSVEVESPRKSLICPLHRYRNWKPWRFGDSYLSLTFPVGH